MKVVITGAAGNLGGKLHAHLKAKNAYQLVALDAEPGGNPDIVRADLTLYDDSWVRQLRDADVIVHFAGDMYPHPSWDPLTDRNITALMNIFEAAVAARVRRLVFASTTLVVHHRKSRGLITLDAPLMPESYYAYTKVVGERVGRSYAERHGLSVICLRIGVIRGGENPPGGNQRSAWAQRKWLSNRDFCQIAEQSINVENVDYAVLYAVSDNAGMRWDLSETRRVLGYVPMDNYSPLPLPLQFVRLCFRRLLRLRNRGRQVGESGRRSLTNSRPIDGSVERS